MEAATSALIVPRPARAIDAVRSFDANTHDPIITMAATSDNAPTVSDACVARLLEWGIRRLYGFPGDGINGVIGALHRREKDIAFIQVAHEELASLAATAHAKFTGEIGACLSTGGPGAIHLLNGLYDAKLDHQPVLAIIGQQSLAGIGGSEQQEVDLQPLLKDVSVYVEMVMKPAQLHHVIDRAIRVARAERGVACVILPHDVQREPYEAPKREHGMQHSAPGYRAPRVLPEDADLDAAAEVLNAGNKVAILAGAGALHAADELVEVAELLGAGIAKSLLGKAAVPDDLPFVTGSSGWLGTRASNEMLKGCDTLFMIGSSFPYTEFLPKEGEARGVQIDIAPRNLRLRFPMEVALAGDAVETLRALIPRLARKADRSWRMQIEQSVRDWKAEAKRTATAIVPPLNPQLPLFELSPRLPDDAIVTSDSSSVVVWAARHLMLRKGMKMSLSGGLATMGSAVPYGIAAKFAFPHRVVIATAGDGAMQMSGNAALIDVSKHWRSWADPRFVVLVLNNRDLNYVTWEQRVMEGEPRFATSQQLPDFPFARYAELLGLIGIRVDSPEAVGPAWERALSADRPVVIEAWVSGDVPTLPPTITAKQAKNIEKALGAGDPDADRVRTQLAVQEIKQEQEK